MTLKCSEVINFMEQFAPISLADDWDNVGLMLGDRNKDVNKILVCLDVRKDVVEEAIDKNVDMIISHHPFIFEKLKRIDFQDYKGELINKLIKNDICVYSAHTNLDVTTGGINDILAEKIGLLDVNNLTVHDVKDKEYGLGKFGMLKGKMSIEEFVALVKAKLEVEVVRLIGIPRKNIQKVAVFCGSYDSNLKALIKNNIDILITGDIKYHTALDMAELGLCAIDAGHFGTEHIVVSRLTELILEKFEGVEVFASKMEQDVFRAL